MSIDSAPPVSNMSSGTVAFGAFRLFPAQRRLEKDGQPLNLGGRACDILSTLVEHAGEIVSKQALIARVWQGVTVDEGNLRFQIASLRKALGDGEAGARYVTNVAGRGYCFTAPVSRAPVSHEPVSRTPVSQIPPATAVSAAPRPRDDHLPPLPARMVGRDEAVEKIAAGLLAHRFVSIVGPGGIGKTTVAMAVSHAMLPRFDGAVHFVDLGPLNEPRLAPGAVASALGLVISAEDPVPSLLSFIRNRHALLVLDSCEHVIEPIAELAEIIFRDAPRVHLLATSRESLRVEGEHIHRLLPLDCPPDDPTLTAAAAQTYPAVQHFVERIVSSGHPFDLSDSNAPVVAAICRKLDGIALALELAAGRVGAYGIEGTAALLDSQFRLRWHGRRTALPRHQTLGATLDWSYNLLPEIEQAVLRRLSVFIGTFSLAGAQAVASDETIDAGQVIDAVAALVAKSLIMAHPGGQQTRYRMLDSTQAYIREKLVDSGEAGQFARRHALYVRDVVDAANLRHSVPRPAPLVLLDTRIDNLRAALQWAFSPNGDIATAIALAAAAGPLFLARPPATECLVWMERAIAALDPTAYGSRLEMEIETSRAVALMFVKGNSEDVHKALLRGLDLAEQLNDPYQQLRMHGALHIFLARIGDFRGTNAIGRRAMEVAAATGDRVIMGMAEWLVTLSHHIVGDQKNAQHHGEAALLQPATPGHHIQLGYDHRVRGMSSLARTLWLRGFGERAIQVAWQTIEEAGQLDHPVSLLIGLLYAGEVLLLHGDWVGSETVVERAIGQAERHSLASYRAMGLGLKGKLAIRLGDADTGIPLLRACLGTLQAHHHETLATPLAGTLVEGLLAAGQHQEASTVIDAAVAQCERAGGSFYDPEIWHLKGCVLVSAPQPDPAGAEAWFLRAIEHAREQSALAWELRATTSLARLYHQQSQSEAARHRLAAVLDRFTPGFDGVDLQAARQLLSELEQH